MSTVVGLRQNPLNLTGENSLEFDFEKFFRILIGKKFLGILILSPA
jgi:hypothetical protein